MAAGPRQLILRGTACDHYGGEHTGLCVASLDVP